MLQTVFSGKKECVMAFSICPHIHSLSATCFLHFSQTVAVLLSIGETDGLPGTMYKSIELADGGGVLWFFHGTEVHGSCKWHSARLPSTISGSTPASSIMEVKCELNTYTCRSIPILLPCFIKHCSSTTCTSVGPRQCLLCHIVTASRECPAITVQINWGNSCSSYRGMESASAGGVKELKKGAASVETFHAV